MFDVTTQGQLFPSCTDGDLAGLVRVGDWAKWELDSARAAVSALSCYAVLL